jgi:hypothetical protein
MFRALEVEQNRTEADQMQTKHASNDRVVESPNRRTPNTAWHSGGALGWNRTSDTRFRKPVLYPLSYEGVPEA